MGLSEAELRSKLEPLDIQERKVLLSHVYCHSDKFWQVVNNAKYTNHAKPPSTGDREALLAHGVQPAPGCPEDAVFALRDIAPGVEITEDYSGYQSFPFYEQLCEEYGVESTSKCAELYS